MSQNNVGKTTKSQSLPKLAENNSNLNSLHTHKKQLSSLHKVNWSITPRCLIEGHEGEPVIYVCVKKECECATRLVCQKCFYSGHASHNKNFMAIDEIKVGRLYNLRFWPFDTQYKQIFQFIKSHNAYIENLIQDIKSAYDNLLQTITTAILETKDKYIERVEKFYTKETKKHEYISQLTHMLEKSLNLKKIQSCVRQVFNKEIRHDVFLKKMNTIINDQTHGEKLQKLKKQFEDTEFKKGKDMNFDMIYFIKKQKVILKNVSELENSIIEREVIVDEATVGLESIIVQTVEYLKKTSTGLYPLSYDQKWLQDGTYYNGFIYKGYRSLLGLRDYRNGFIYFGEWKNNCRNGWGVYEHRENGYKYAGNWKEDKRNGYGKETTATYTYEGNFINDKKQGFGSINQDGVRFDITWKNDKKNGKGKRLDQYGETQVYFLNGVESLVKGSAVNPTEGQKRDVNFLAKMFGKGE